MSGATGFRCREERDLVKYAEGIGWKVEKRNGMGHLNLVHANGETLGIPSSFYGKWKGKFESKLRKLSVTYGSSPTEQDVQAAIVAASEPEWSHEDVVAAFREAVAAPTETTTTNIAEAIMQITTESSASVPPALNVSSANRRGRIDYAEAYALLSSGAAGNYAELSTALGVSEQGARNAVATHAARNGLPIPTPTVNNSAKAKKLARLAREGGRCDTPVAGDATIGAWLAEQVAAQQSAAVAAAATPAVSSTIQSAIVALRKAADLLEIADEIFVQAEARATAAEARATAAEADVARIRASIRALAT